MVENLVTVISSKDKTVKISRDLPTVIIGERINPTGRKAVLAALKEGNFDIVREDAVKQVAAGAAILDVNAGVPGADETALLQKVMQEVMSVTDVPLCIDTADPEALSAALSVYEGKALINSVNGEERSLDAVLPLAKEHGAAVIGLCMISPENIAIDPLALTMGADSNAGRIALETIELVVKEFGVNVTMGASNISFGMPDRKYINATFIAMAIHAGLTCPITNPLVMEVNTAVLAADLSMGRDEYGMNWIKAYRNRQKANAS
ncbi:MAG: dihydropteroate synthase [Anaerolineae bacterium]